MGDYVGGDEPNTVDMILFGILQYHFSNPVPPIASLQTDPKLPRVRSWIGTMQRRFATYPHLYSGVYFEPASPAPVSAPTLERIAFWLGSLCMVAAFPITVSLALLVAARTPRTAPGA